MLWSIILQIGLNWKGRFPEICGGNYDNSDTRLSRLAMPNRSLDLPLHARQRHALDKGALGQEEEHDNGHNGHRAGSHEQRPIGLAGAGKAIEANGQCVLRFVAEVDQRAEEIIPVGQKGKEGDGGQRGPGQGQDDAPVDVKLTGPVDLGCRRQLVRDGHVELAQQKDKEGIAKKGWPGQRMRCAYPAQVAEDQKGGDQDHRIGDHQRGDQKAKERIAPRPVDAGKAIGH